MSTVNGFQVGSETLKYNYESLDNYNTPNFSTSSSTAYAVGDYVMYNGKLYKCTTATTGGTWVSGSWTEAVLSDDVGDLSRQLSDVESDLTEIFTNTGIEHNITDEFSFTNGYGVYYRDGTLGTSSVQSCSNFVPIPSGYDHIILTTVIRPDNVSFGTAFYSTASTSDYISGVKNTVDETKTLLDSEMSVFTIPQNAKYIRTSWIATTYSTYSSHTFYCALVKTGELEVTQQKVEYIEPTDVDGFIRITKDEMESGSFDSGYFPNGNRCRNKNHYIKARKGDIVVGHRKTADIIMAVIDNPDSTSVLYTSNWRTADFALATPYDGYYVLLGKTALADFDGEFTIYPAKQFFKALPERYYLDEIATTLESITDKQTEPCLCFPLITDIHYGATATSSHPYLFHKTYRNLLKVIQEKRSDAIVCLGDVTDGNFSMKVGIDFGTRVNGMFKMLPVPYLLTIGNHDDNRYYSAAFNASDIAKVNTAYISNTVVYNAATNGRDYYIDFSNYKIRLISIDAVDNLSYAYNTDTVTWFTNTALDTPDNYLAVILTHVSPVSSQNYNNTEVTNGTAIVQAIEAYISSGKDAFQLYGHSHCDAAFTSPYLSIATCCSKYTNENGDPTKWPSGATMPTRTEYTATEDCWDYVIIRPQSKKVNLVRFGAGDDREFIYGTV